jgi:hypothetical protein
VLFLPPIRPSSALDGVSQAWLSLDWIGIILSVGMVTLFLIPIQWGGNVRPWNDPTVVSLLVLVGCIIRLCGKAIETVQSGVFFLSFITWEYKKGENSILPLYMFKRRNMLGACIEGVIMFDSDFIYALSNAQQFFVNVCFILASVSSPSHSPDIF